MDTFKIKPRVLLVGNPNAGKTMLFNRLTGLKAHVANYPGITVDLREGNLNLPSKNQVCVVDLPGTYSLYSRSEDETVTVKGVLGQLGPSSISDLIVAVVDATQLKRNLYLVSQLLDLKKPLLLALTMMDEVQRQGIEIKTLLLSQRLSVPVVSLSSVTGVGIDALLVEIDQWVKLQTAQVEPSRSTHSQTLHKPSATDITKRYQQIEVWLQGVLKNTIKTPKKKRFCADDILLHLFWGPIFLILVFAVMFESLFLGATPFMNGIENGISYFSNIVRSFFPDDSLIGSLITDGIISGVGSVIVFIPLIAILFLFIGVLEDSGYLARATFLLDRFMSKVGLSGRAFVPLLSGFACAVPAIMATRVIESKKDRFVTILVTPLMSCSARLPIYGLLIAAVFASAPPLWGFIEIGALVMLSMYGIGIIAAFGVAALLKRFVLKGPTPSLILELPPYRMPRWSSLAQNIWTRIWLFLREAGTVILAMTIILWGLFTFPRNETQQTTKNQSEIQAQIKNSYAGQLGQLIEPVVAPLGFDWKISVGILSSFAAREVFVSTLGVMYGLGHSQDETKMTLKEAIQNDINPQTGKPVYTPLVALSLMIFYSLAMQCMSTLAATKKETKSWRWPAFQFSYMTVLAWLCSFALFQAGSALGF